MLRRLLSMLAPKVPAESGRFPDPATEELTLLRVETLLGIEIDRDRYRRYAAAERQAYRELAEARRQGPEAVIAHVRQLDQALWRRLGPRGFQELAARRQAVLAEARERPAT